MSTITRKDIDKLATLSRLSLTEEEKETFVTEIGSILTYVDQVTKVGATLPKGEMLGTNYNRMREDSDPHETGVFTDKLLTLAPESEDGYVKVKKIL